MLVPRDTDGLKCGVDSEVKDKPYLVFFDLAKCADPLVPISGCPTPQACVKECPKETFIYRQQDCKSETFQVYNNKLVCSRHVKMNNCDDVDKYMQNDQCARWYLKSYSCKLLIFNWLFHLSSLFDYHEPECLWVWVELWVFLKLDFVVM